MVESLSRSFISEKKMVEMLNITKRFPGVVANNQIDLDLRLHEIHALLGENGAGKTTLMNILYGLYRPSGGEILVDGKPAVIKSPKDAISLGIGMVHQHFMLIPGMTVTENIILGLKSSKEPFLDLGSAIQRIIKLSKTYNLQVDPRARIEQLSIGERQRVEIMKALYRNVRVLILDEPTSVLTPQETEDFFRTLHSMVEKGLTIVFISHKLPDVMSISDRITVLRRGKVVARMRTSETNPVQLAEKMVGKQSVYTFEKSGSHLTGLVVEVTKLRASNDKGLTALEDVSFSIKQGEILGVAGVAGNGQRELAEVLAGMRKPTAGKIEVEGKDLTNSSPREIIARGVGHIPEDRSGMGLIMDFSVAENLILEVRSKTPFSDTWIFPFGGRYFVNGNEIRSFADGLIREYGIVTPSVNSSARTLSGGNLQRLLLAKVLSRSPKLLIAAHPTHGLDIGATEFIWRKLDEQRKRGVAILLISGDLNEIMSLSDRIAIMYRGKIVKVIPAAGAEIKEIGLLMAGEGS